MVTYRGSILHTLIKNSENIQNDHTSVILQLLLQGLSKVHENFCFMSGASVALLPSCPVGHAIGAIFPQPRR